MRRLFSDRYKDLIHTGNGEPVDEITGDVPYSLKGRVADVMLDFREPCLVSPNRYDDTVVEDDALNLAVEALNNHLGYELINLYSLMYGTCLGDAAPLQNLFTPYLFDLIELQYDELSDEPENGKEGFRKEINETFRENDSPWMFADGRLLKIDSKQFEQDLKLKALETLRQLRDAEPIYQAAYDELVKAVEFLEKGDLAEAVGNAEKSYESILKVICGDEAKDYAANRLTKMIVEKESLPLPEGLKGDAFQSNVLMSLPTIRNKAAAHGAGPMGNELDKPLANLAVNLACALDLYLIQETSS